MLKRQSRQRDFKLIKEQIARVGRCKLILDLPCSGSCLTPAFSDSAALVIEADTAHGQLLFSRAESSVATPRIWMTASAFHIPLRDASVDGTICVRLSHHLPTAAERERLLTELLRVSRRFVIMTFFDHHSLKNLLRRLRRPFNRQPPKTTMTTACVAELAMAGGARLIAAPPLSWSHGKRDPHGRIELLVTLEVAGATALDKLLQRPGTVTELGPLLRSLAAHARCGRVARRHGATQHPGHSLRMAPRPAFTSSTCPTATSSRRASRGRGWRPSTCRT